MVCNTDMAFPSMQACIWCRAWSPICFFFFKSTHHASHKLQILAPLPRHLQVSVLQVADACLDTILDNLPAGMHPQALCAKFPSITISNSLSLHGTTLSPTASMHALAAAAQFTALTSLCLTDIDTGAAASCVGDTDLSPLALAGEKPTDYIDVRHPVV
jgi:hypothetical protein